MHILFFTDNFPPEVNASATRVYERACHWVKWGHRVTIITCAPNYPAGKLYPGYQNKWHSEEYIDGIRVIRVKSYIAENKGTLKRFLDQSSFTVTSLIAGLKVSDADIIVASSPTLFAALAAKWLSKIKRKPFVLEVADLWPESIAALSNIKTGLIYNCLHQLACRLYKHAKQIILVSPGFQKRMQALKIEQAKLNVVINGVELSHYSPEGPNCREELGLSTDDFVIGYIGTHGMAHALINVIEAAELNPNIKYLFVGNGAEKQIIVEAANNKKLPNVIFVEQQAKSRISHYWRTCDVALVHLKPVKLFTTVIPSKIFEAMAFGLPIIFAGPKGVGSKIIEEEQAGLCIESGLPEKLAQACQTLSNDKKRYKQLSENSLKAAPRHTRETQARQYLDVLEKALPNKTCNASISQSPNKHKKDYST